jgi:hypothetical protein
MKMHVHTLMPVRMYIRMCMHMCAHTLNACSRMFAWTSTQRQHQHTSPLVQTLGVYAACLPARTNTSIQHLQVSSEVDRSGDGGDIAMEDAALSDKPWLSAHGGFGGMVLLCGDMLLE